MFYIQKVIRLFCILYIYTFDVLILSIYYRMLTKRAQGRKKFGRKNFKQRYFKLTTRDLSYAKQKGKYYLEF